MQQFTSAEWILIITTIVTGVVTIIGAITGNTRGKSLDAAKERLVGQDIKLDNLQYISNGNLAKALNRCDELMAENAKLKLDLAAFNQRRTE